MQGFPQPVGYRPSPTFAFSAPYRGCLLCGRLAFFIFHFSFFIVHVASGDVHYVDVASTNAMAPYTNWSAAATAIQDAVDAASEGDTVLVNDGAYDGGGKPAHSWALTNRVAIDKPVVVASVNGPETTWLVGAGPAGDGAVRCAYVGSNATLSGFTLTNGHTRADGDWTMEMSGGGAWCDGAGVLSNCVLTGNACEWCGGGVFWGVLIDCQLTHNWAFNGGGAHNTTLEGCTLTANAAYVSGGGTGGGTLSHCTVTGNSASEYGGGVNEGTAYSCLVAGNWSYYGGGTSYGASYNCTVIGNSGICSGGGSYGGSRYNCVVCFNDSPVDANWSGGAFSNCCSMPMPPGNGNISANPRLASASHLASDSPCIGAGSNAYASGTDIDNEAWGDPPSIGCDEVHEGAVTGALTVAAWASCTQAMPGVVLEFREAIEGRLTASVWDFGDGTVLSNQPFAQHAYESVADYDVVLTACNETYPGGLSATVTVQVLEQMVHYVSAESPAPAAPFTDWSSAATTIQDAVDAATQAGALVLVSNGVYAAGGKAVYGAMTNRVAIDKPIVVRSVNGPESTSIAGHGPNGDAAVRCVYLGANATLSGFTLSNGHTRTTGDPEHEQSGGGAWCGLAAVIRNCVLSSNSAGWQGGGVSGGTVYNCVLVDNSAGWAGGGARYASLHNCTLACNSAPYYGGGAYDGALYNCIAYLSPVSQATVNYCYMGDDPLFVDTNAGNYWVQIGSPCVDAGVNQAWMWGAADLDGNSRILNGTVDIGAYEVPFFARPRVLLQGAYDTSAHRMSTLLGSNLHPVTPYACDARSATSAPTSATDWIQLELCGTNGQVAVARSAWLNADGYVVGDDGTTGLVVGVKADEPYQLVLKHRNHLAAMSAEPLVFTNQLVSYDFTTNPSCYFGGTNACIELEPGVWGMIAGDADGDGKITWVDRVIASNQVGRSGYWCGDADLSGVVEE
ncbi:MAG: hypothetical protein JXR37_27190 [Kiritimatiellae bacterium]|nr:hypothetical protein [Kiritimatiellia bacterium]